MSEVWCYAYAEDLPSCSVIRKLIAFQNARSKSGTQLRLMPGFPENKKGSGNLKKMIPAVRNMVRDGVVAIILTDLDTVECAPELIRNWFSARGGVSVVPKGLFFRVAVREVESWLIADRSVIARFLNIPISNFSEDPDLLDDPKAHLLGIINAKGTKKIHREMLPGRYSRVGPEYNNVLCNFVSRCWNPERAAKNSLSLSRALSALKEI
jgi:hypothetical protein